MNYDIGLATLTTYADGFLGTQVDLAAPGSTCPAGETHPTNNRLARPLDPALDASGDVDPTQATQCLYSWDSGGTLHTIPLGDPRVMPLLPTLDPGGAVDWGGVPPAVGYAQWSGLGGYRIIPAPGQSILLGSPAAQPLAIAPVLTSYLTALEAALTALVAIVEAKLVPSTPSTAPVTAALQALTAVRATLATTITKAI
jgi:hypothetical protein